MDLRGLVGGNEIYWLVREGLDPGTDGAKLWEAASENAKWKMQNQNVKLIPGIYTNCGNSY
jgi:hypothetical protein